MKFHIRLLPACCALLLISGLAIVHAQPSGRVIGALFGDTYLKASGEEQLWGSGQYAGESSERIAVKLRRIQLGYEYRFDQRFSGTVLLEATDTPDVQDLSGDVFVKEAHLTWHNTLGDLHIGVITTPLFTYMENAWGYRAIEKEVLQIYTDESSTALGVSFVGDANDHVGYHLMVGSYGAGTALYGSTQIQLGHGLHTELMLGMLPREGDAMQVGRVFLGLDNDWGNFGISATGASEVDGDKEATRLIGSAFAVVPLTRAATPINLFTRYDYYDPDLDFSETANYDNPEAFYRQHLMIAGLDVQVHPRISFMPNVWINAYTPRTDTYPSRDADVVLRLTIRLAFP